MAGGGGHREAPQLRVAGDGQPCQQRTAAARAQHLLGRPQGVAPARGADHDELREVDPGGSERRRIRQVGRRDPGHAPALPGQRRERRQDELQLADPLALAQEFREPARWPSAAGQLAIQEG